MELIHIDRDVVVCIKPPRVLSTDEPGGMPDLIREALGDPKANIRTVHRLDRVVSGLMVFARTNTAYLGKYTDPTYGTFEADFMTQFHCVEEFEFPETACQSAV